jgi:dihydrofolate reductase
MGHVVLDMAMSLDGFIAGPNDDDGGLHNYFFSPTDATAGVIEEGFKTTGAIIMGRRTYDVGAEQNGFAENPYDVPTFIVSHTVPETIAQGAEAFVFVTDIESALKQARAAAGERDTIIGGGAKLAQAYLKAGLVEQLHIHLVPVLLGVGKRLFEVMGDAPVTLRAAGVVEAADVTHLKFDIVTSGR